jgi:hypothetical protein
MEPPDAAVALAEPLGTVAGATFYFSPQSAARAVAIGIDVVALYAAGRGGVLGNAGPVEVDEAFFFFKPGMIAGLVAGARATAPLADILEAHLASADDFARATFGGIEPAVLMAFDAAGSTVVGSLPAGMWPLVDGYRSATLPGDPRTDAFRWAILLRELRGGVHRDAAEAAGLTGAVACQFDRGDGYYALHGFGDEDRVAETPEVLGAKASAEQATDERMGELLSVLDEDGIEALVVGALALHDALAAPVPAG